MNYGCASVIIGNALSISTGRLQMPIDHAFYPAARFFADKFLQMRRRHSP
jgi:hypothetical protein